MFCSCTEVTRSNKFAELNLEYLQHTTTLDGKFCKKGPKSLNIILVKDLNKSLK